MALLPNLRAPSRLTPPTSLERVEAWTVSQLSSTLASTTLTPRVTSITLDIPLDTTTTTTQPTSPPPRPRSEPAHTVHKHRAPIRRDSQHRREALLKGKEGSRRRQRWENDRLLSNPHAQPPLPSDWEVQPTYTRRTVPYFLAPLWDTEFAARAAGERGRERGEVGREAAEVRELRARLKKARGAKGLLQDLEEGVRGFIEQWEDKERELESEGVIEADSEDEEIVFVGRNGVMSDERRREREMETVEKDKLIFQSLVDDHGAAFGRYLVHSIAAYYGLQTWSVTKGDPARREAYVGLKVDPKTRRPSWSRSEMPRPLWAVVC
ncbi:hypothetical protein LTR91_004146 [Friedmanniomyces endolithicus]|uniref:R3H-associated N-terminal domain-containing protein n=1 Tax=Friedmanniomyces endolithicus TaxID=329885 RepID=A0AAN6QZ83_9PEZI|nr:hypothetical protein LTR94_008269 [Friedmanniomyces endolithicus]KAK0792355.1 hypothetical protein LTR59_008557 [Friedmanniomyces endolithicus]KAK0815703.1 hypothetical protein LTR38_002349 [Friedmanniomyces endolithicus]KAK0821314.1 hypothetical protein LTR75_000787 [Friedmanniomyces endolithicus]KAK0841251.1 hypothetical protein LTR03_010035 [Friedmanniomyces endolithicus]